MYCESCGVVLAKTEESQNDEKCSQFSMLKKAYFELGHQHMDCPSGGGSYSCFFT